MYSKPRNDNSEIQTVYQTDASTVVEDAETTTEDVLKTESIDAPPTIVVVEDVQASASIEEDTVNESDELKLKAQSLFMHLKSEAEEDGQVNLDELDDVAATSPEDDVEDIAKSHYNKQIKQLKYEQTVLDEEKDEEILELKELLEEQKRKAKEYKASSQEKMTLEEKIDPIVQQVVMNGVRSKLLICNFKPNKGRIGLQFKRYGSQFFIIDVVENTQISKYNGIGPGLLLYQCVTCVPGQSTGTNICVQHSDELALRIFQEFSNGKNIQMSFLILPEKLPVQNIQQHVLKVPTRHVQYVPQMQMNNMRRQQYY